MSDLFTCAGCDRRLSQCGSCRDGATIGGQTDGFYAEVQLPQEMSLYNLAELLDFIDNVDKGVHRWYYPSDRKLKIVIERPYTLREAPPSTHEFARGWLVHRTMVRIAAMIGNPIEWTPVDWHISSAQFTKSYYHESKVTV